MRHLLIILGDQLNHDSVVFQGFDPKQDAIWMAEVDHETTHVWCHKLRIAYFLSAMRHFREELKRKKREVHYHELTADPTADTGKTFGEILTSDVQHLRPQKLIVVETGDDRVSKELIATADTLGLELEVRDDEHFYCSRQEFEEYADGRNSLLLEYFYREMRKRHSILVDDSGKPEAGQWNLDHDNRESFSKTGPGDIPAPKIFKPDAITKAVIAIVAERFDNHPGSLDHFQLPVTRRQSLAFLTNFMEHLLPNFGRWEDAMWTDEAFLYHSRLSAMLNLKLLSPQECVEDAVIAYQTGHAELNSVEGFVRQILGWREFVRGVYWLKMPEYRNLNHLQHERKLPKFFWDGDTDMQCISQSMKHVIDHGYSHHIHRLMVLGNFSQLWGVHPHAFHEWHMAMYLDAIDWVSLPNTLGMSQYGDGGIVGTKPYCSSGNYINKMSNFCKSCRYDIKKRVGDDACPFTSLYWEFMDRHYDLLKNNARMKFPIKNLEKMRAKPGVVEGIRERVAELHEKWDE